MNSFTKKTNIGLWLVIFLFSLLCQGQNAMAQWGLVDTVWVRRDVGGGAYINMSPNDSLYLSQNGLFKTSDGSLLYLLDSLSEIYPKFIDDTTAMFTWGDFIGKINLNTKQRVKMLNCKGFLFYHNLNPYNYNPYSKYDNCVYETNEFNSRKLNLETGEITEVPYLKGLDGSSISQDGEVLAGFYFQGQWLDGKYVYDLYFRVISLKTGEILIPDKLLLTKLDSPTDHNPEFIFSRDHRYLNVFSFGISHLWNLDAKLSLKDLPTTFNINSINKIGYSKIIFSKDNTKLLTTKSYAHKIIEYPWVKLDSLSYLIINLITLKETEYMFPVGVWVGGKLQAFVFDDYHLLCDQAWTYENNFEKQIMLGNSCLLKLNIDINSINLEKQKDDNGGILYPNPAEDYILIDSPSIKRGLGGVSEQIRIFDIYGNEIHPPRPSGTPQEGNKYRIDVSTLPAGVYFVRIGNEKPMKFVKM